jgi:hypothetical protein
MGWITSHAPAAGDETAMHLRNFQIVILSS